MLLLSREPGQSLIIEDVRLTVIRATSDDVELSLRKIIGGTPSLVTLQRGTPVDACYDVKITYVTLSDNRVRIGIDAPRELSIAREEAPPRDQ
ncbi:MAG: hypothetical protein CMJ48_09295 [Planctomycetaceae bacterium]|nr:hypothetical protein [Planctomycetaceae bacterium]